MEAIQFEIATPSPFLLNLAEQVKQRWQPVKQVVTEPEFAALVKRSRATLIRQRNAGEIPYRRNGRNVFYLLPDDLDAYHEAMKRDAFAGKAKRK